MIRDEMNDFVAESIDAGMGFPIAKPQPQYLIVIGPQDNPLVTIDLNGTVTIYRPGAEVEAARIFWNEIEFQGKSLITRVQELENDLAMRHRFLDFGQPLTEKERASARKSGVITPEFDGLGGP